MKHKPGLIERMLFLILFGYIVSACGLLTDPPREQQNEDDENTAVSQGVEFGDVVTAGDIGANNEPLDVADYFSSSQDVIYVVAEADYIDAGTTLFARWAYEGEPFEDSSMLTANQTYEDTYVEFHLENLSGEMDSGEYSVQLYANGNLVETVDFTVE